MTSRTFILNILIFFIGCAEPYPVEVDGKSFLVVDGSITNHPGPHSVKLSLSTVFADELNGGHFLPIEGAQVSVVDNEGNRFELEDVGRGIYQTRPEVQGVIGRAYSIQILTDDEKYYQSVEEVLQEPVRIDSVYFKRTKKDDINQYGNVEQQGRIQYYIDFTIEEGSYLRWDWESTFQFKNPDDPFNSNQLCYVNESSTQFVKLLDGTHFSERLVQNEELVDIGIDWRYNFEHSLNVKQYSMSEEAYQFWELIRKQLKQIGTIFDPTPGRIIGNVHNMNDPDEPVLGYFGAYGLTEKRVFVEAAEIGKLIQVLEVCTTDPPGAAYCDDCTEYPGAYLQKPSWWK